MFCTDDCGYSTHATHQLQEIPHYPESLHVTESDQNNEVAHVGMCYVTERPKGLSIDCNVPTPSSFNFESYNFSPLRQNEALTMYTHEPISSMSYAYYRPELIDLPPCKVEVVNSIANSPSCAQAFVRQQQPIPSSSAAIHCEFMKQQKQQEQRSNKQQTFLPSPQAATAAGIASANSQTLLYNCLPALQPPPQQQQCSCISATPAAMTIPMQTQPKQQVASQQVQCNCMPLQVAMTAQPTTANCSRPQQQSQQLQNKDAASDGKCAQNTCRYQVPPPKQIQQTPEFQAQVQQQVSSTCTNFNCNAMKRKQQSQLANLQLEIQPNNSNNNNCNSEQQEQKVIRFDLPCFLTDCNCNSPTLQPVQQQQQQQQQQQMTIQYPCTLMSFPNNVQRVLTQQQELPAQKTLPPSKSTSSHQNNWSPTECPCPTSHLESNHFPQNTANNCMKVGCTTCNCWHFPRYSNWLWHPCVGVMRIAEHNSFKTATCSQRRLS